MEGIFCGHTLGDMKGAQHVASKARLLSDAVDKVKFLVASCVSIVPQFHDLPISSIFRNREEVAFSHPIHPTIVVRWVPPPEGLYKLNFVGGADGN